MTDVFGMFNNDPDVLISRWTGITFYSDHIRKRRYNMGSVRGDLGKYEWIHDWTKGDLERWFERKSQRFCTEKSEQIRAKSEQFPDRPMVKFEELYPKCVGQFGGNYAEESCLKGIKGKQSTYSCSVVSHRLQKECKDADGKLNFDCYKNKEKQWLWTKTYGFKTNGKTCCSRYTNNEQCKSPCSWNADDKECTGTLSEAQCRELLYNDYATICAAKTSETDCKNECTWKDNECIRSETVADTSADAVFLQQVDDVATPTKSMDNMYIYKCVDEGTGGENALTAKFSTKERHKHFSFWEIHKYLGIEPSDQHTEKNPSKVNGNNKKHFYGYRKDAMCDNELLLLRWLGDSEFRAQYSTLYGPEEEALVSKYGASFGIHSFASDHFRDLSKMTFGEGKSLDTAQTCYEACHGECVPVQRISEVKCSSWSRNPTSIRIAPRF